MTIDVNDIVGKQFGRLTVISYDHREEHIRTNGKRQYQYFYKCQCSCVNKTIVVVNRFDLMRNDHPTRSCGCLVSELGKSNKTHGDSTSRFYHIWQCMIQRCTNPNDENYKKYYIDMGTSVCNEWSLPAPQGYLNFKNDMYESYLEFSKIHGESNTTLDRIDPFGNYEPSNCRWATPSMQNSNKKNTQYYTYQGQEYTKKQLYDNFTVNLSWNGFCGRLNKLETNEITDPEIFYHYISPIIDAAKYFSDEYWPKYIEKVKQDKEKAREELIKRMRNDMENK